MKILIDLDSTAADLMKAWLAAINKDFAEQHGEFTLPMVKTWKVGDHHPAGAAVYEYLERRNFFADLAPMGNVQEVLHRSFAAGDEHFIVTDVVGKAALQCEREKRDWVRQIFPWIPLSNIFCMHNKNVRKVHIARALGISLAIEDGPHHIEELHEDGRDILAIGYEYNRHVADKCLRYISPEEHQYSYMYCWNTFEQIINNKREELKYIF